jgi:hypothetical protein
MCGSSQCCAEADMNHSLTGCGLLTQQLSGSGGPTGGSQVVEYGGTWQMKVDPQRPKPDSQAHSASADSKPVDSHLGKPAAEAVPPKEACGSWAATLCEFGICIPPLSNGPPVMGAASATPATTKAVTAQQKIPLHAFILFPPKGIAVREEQPLPRRDLSSCDSKRFDRAKV